MVSNCFHRFKRLKNIAGVSDLLRTEFVEVTNFYKINNDTIKQFLDEVDLTEFFNYFWKYFRVRFNEFRIGWEDTDDFAVGFNKIMMDNFLKVLFSYFSLKNINVQEMIKQSFNMQETQMRHKDSEGNYQSASWDEGSLMQTSENEEKSTMLSGNIVNTLKGMINKPILFSMSAIVNNFDSLFFISHTLERECFDECYC